MFGISDDPNNVCLQDRVVYTCIVPNVLTWTVGGVQIGSYVSGQSNTFEGATRMNGALPEVVANLTDVNGTTFTSTLTIPSAGSVTNGSMILCEGLAGDRDSTVLRHRGKMSYRGEMSHEFRILNYGLGLSHITYGWLID